MQPFACPVCKLGLQHVQKGAANFWACARCGGRSVSLALMRGSTTQAFVKELWARTYEAGIPNTGRPCPACRKALLTTRVRTKEAAIELDVCRTCQLVWIDGGEIALIPGPARPGDVPRPREPPRPRTPDVDVLQGLGKPDYDESSFSFGEWPEQTWKILPALFGIPVEYDAQSLRRLPLSTWILVIVSSCVSIACFSQGDVVFPDWGFVPQRPASHFGATLLTPFFLHAGWLHLVGNMYFLMTFGDNVEDYLGPGRYLLLLGLATACGCLTHAALDLRSAVPLVGASAGISGVIAFYALHLPRAQLGVFIFFRWVSFPAWVGALLWVLQQAVGATEQALGASSASAFAHLGGAVAGLGAWSLWGRKIPSPRRSPR